LQGTQYYIWKLSDLRESLKTFSLFLFRAAASEMWKLNEGAVVAVLNPGILDNRYVVSVSVRQVTGIRVIVSVCQADEMYVCSG